MKIQVSQLVVRYLERLGVDYIFGIPGAHILPVYDALYDSSIHTILTKHEQGASFMAGGYARSSGKIGACITTAGPGATNLVTGVANAYADGQPLIIITGETSTHIFGKGGLQESSGEGGSIDQSELFSGITRYNRIIERTDYLPQVLNRASQILLSDNPGPVLLSFPYNVQKELVDEAVLDRVKTTSRVHSVHRRSPVAGEIADLILAAERPVVIAGYGCIRSGAQAAVARLSELLDIPVTTSLKAKGVVSEQSDRALGSLGVTSSGHAYKYVTAQADLLLVLGAGFNERTSYLWDPALLEGKKIVQVDTNPEQLEKVFTADVAIKADILDTLTGVLEQLEKKLAHSNAAGRRRPALAELHKTMGQDSSVFLSGFPLVEKFYAMLEREFPSDAVFFDDNIVFAQNFLRVSSNNRFYPNSGISSLGHAIPAAIGARFAEAKATFAILGDGGFQMCCMEIMTAVNYGLPLNVVMFNNATMGLIRKNQFQQYRERFISCDFINPDFALLARSFGIDHWRIADEGDLDTLFARANLTGAINLIEILIDKNAFPNYVSKR